MSLTDLYFNTSFFCTFQPSFRKVVPPSFLELGLAELVSIYSDLSQMGKPPAVVDAADLQQDPEVIIFYVYMICSDTPLCVQ